MRFMLLVLLVKKAVTRGKKSPGEDSSAVLPDAVGSPSSIHLCALGHQMLPSPAALQDVPPSGRTRAPGNHCRDERSALGAACRLHCKSVLGLGQHESEAAWHHEGHDGCFGVGSLLMLLCPWLEGAARHIALATQCWGGAVLQSPDYM